MMVYSATVVSIRGLELAQPSPTNLHVKRRLHDTTGCPTGCVNKNMFDSCNPTFNRSHAAGRSTGFTAGCIV